MPKQGWGGEAESERKERPSFLCITPEEGGEDGMGV